MTVFRLLALLIPLMGAIAQASAQTCTAEDFGTAVDAAGAALRSYNTEATPKLQARIKALALKKKWAEAEANETAIPYLQDERLSRLDETSNTLLAKIDTLGRLEPGQAIDCSKLDELKTAGIELLAVMKAKTAYLVSKIDADLAATAVASSPAAAPPAPALKETLPPPVAPVPPAPSAKTESATSTAGKPEAKPEPSPAKAPAPTTKTEPAPPVTKKPAAQPSWETKTAEHPAPVAPPAQVAIMATPPPAPAPTPDSPAAGVPRPSAPMTQGAVPGVIQPDDGYTIDEIRDATSGFFGGISTSLAAVIEHAFEQSGRPTGYILGQEGGGAFLGGLRYGKGLLYVRSGGTQQIFWHGPSVGFDIGAAGSQTMFLVYKMKDPSDLYRVFSGIDGSAYVVGGVGVTLLGGGGMLLAPIRSGIGVRVGANIGYLRLTPTQTWNPF